MIFPIIVMVLFFALLCLLGKNCRGGKDTKPKKRCPKCHGLISREHVDGVFWDYAPCSRVCRCDKS